MATSPGAALAAPASTASSGVVVAQSAACRVALVAVSYDDPGADDAEFIELWVDKIGAAVPRGTCDASIPGSDRDAATPVDAATGPVLGDCGLGALELVDGASAACETYREIPLSSVAIPADGYVLLCPAGSSVDARSHCDVTTAGRSALRAGWLQNGPNDGLRFVDTDGGVVLEVGYEGGPPCFGAAAASLAPESGGTTSDDVNAACGGAFALLPEEEAPLREQVRCPGTGVGGVADAAGIIVTPDGGTDARGGAADGKAGTEPDASPWTPERAPAPAPRRTAPTYGHIDVDAGITLLGRPPPGFPRPPACTVALGRRAPAFTPLLFAGSVLLTRRMRRRRRDSTRKVRRAVESLDVVEAMLHRGRVCRGLDGMHEGHGARVAWREGADA